MGIWKSFMTLQEMMQVREQTMSAHLGIEFIEMGDDYLKATMPVDERTMQPFGIMHGGASCVLAETLGSVAGCLCVDQAKYVCVGLGINTHHIKMVKSGYVYGIAKPEHLGKKTQVWNIVISDENGNCISISRLSLIVLEK